MTAIAPKYLPEARDLHRRTIVVDTHCDTVQRLMKRPAWNIARCDDEGHIDIPRLQEGGVTAIFFAVWARKPAAAEDGTAAAREQLDAIERMVDQNPDHLLPARSADDIRRAHELQRIAIVPAIEGGYLIAESLDVLRGFHSRRAAYMTLTHSFHTSWADSAGVHATLEPLHGGLTHFGREVVREMNRIGMMVDVSHVSDATFWDVMEVAEQPVIASHSSCRAVAPHRRNITDEMMRAVADSGGVVQINFAAHFVDPNAPEIAGEAMEQWITRGCEGSPPGADHQAPLSCLVDHFDHALQTVGSEHVGIGSDFDGVPAVPVGMEHCGRLPHLTALLMERGYSARDLEGMLGGNVLRVMDSCGTGVSDSTLPGAGGRMHRGSGLS